MNKKQLAVAVVLFDFAAFTIYAAMQHGFIGIFEQVLVNTAAMQVGLDLVISLGLVNLWIWHDARQHGISPLPYMLLSCALGSIAPLLYLVRRFGLDPAVASTPAGAERAQVARASA